LLIKCSGQTSHQSISKVIFSYQVLLDASNKHKHSTFGLQLLKKISKILKIFDFFGLFLTFEAVARPSALKILKIRRTKNMFNECPQLFRLQLFLIFAYLDFAPPYVDGSYIAQSQPYNRTVACVNCKKHVWKGLIIRFLIVSCDLPDIKNSKVLQIFMANSHVLQLFMVQPNEHDSNEKLCLSRATPNKMCVT
jgi:hypothetical protein